MGDGEGEAIRAIGARNGAAPSKRPSLTALELASGVPLGEQPDALPLPLIDPALQARVALEDAIRPALACGRCVVGFSGGRDSSALLALAVHVARRDGLPLPVPASLRYRDLPEADESEWQELVIRHLGLADWVRLDISDDVDYLGPVAQSVLARHGVLWPAYFYSYRPLMAQATDGVFMTGIDGDGLFGGWRWGGLGPLRRRPGRPLAVDILRLSIAYAPEQARRVAARRHRLSFSWLTPAALAELNAGWFVHYAQEPVRWDRRVAWWSRLRGLALAVSSLDVLGSDCGAAVANPLLDRRFLAALAAQGGSSGCGDRTAIMQGLFADLLPAEVVSRPTKAAFGGGWWGDASKAFAAGWDGSGVDETLVDVAELRAEWTTARPTLRTIGLLQHAWLSGAETSQVRERGEEGIPVVDNRKGGP